MQLPPCQLRDALMQLAGVFQLLMNRAWAQLQPVGPAKSAEVQEEFLELLDVTKRLRERARPLQRIPQVVLPAGAVRKLELNDEVAEMGGFRELNSCRRLGF